MFPCLKVKERNFDGYLEFKEVMSRRVCLILDSKRRVLCLVVRFDNCLDVHELGLYKCLPYEWHRIL